MKKVWILGAGQLGAMLERAGRAIGVDTRAIGFDADLSVLDDLHIDDVVSPEIESWPATKITKRLSSHTGLQNEDVFPIIADRLTQKQSLDRLDVATADWLPVDEGTTAAALYKQLGSRILLKKRTGGYDGRGQFWLLEDEATEIPDEFIGTSIAEQAIGFSDEISIIGCRDAKGDLRFYPPALNLHNNGILKASVAGVNLPKENIKQAEAMLTKVMEGMDYVGVMAMECFLVDYQLVVNELAPRVHNSGHWTQAGSSVCQFESHVRAIAGLPIGKPQTKGATVMINIVGESFNPLWLDIPGAEVTWYGKEVRAGRKLGHINFCEPNAIAMQSLADTLPQDDKDAIKWAMAMLTEHTDHYT